MSLRSRSPAALATLIVASLVASVVAVVVRSSSGSLDAAKSGSLAPLLAAHRAAAIEAKVASPDRAGLSKARLVRAWDAAVSAAGSFQRVSRTLTVDEGSDRMELEVLSFEHGTGTLTARRTPLGISAMWLLVGTEPDPAVAKAGATYSLDLVSGRLQAVSAAFNGAMKAALPPAQFQSATALAIGGLRPPVRQVAQVVVRRVGSVVVETYLFFKNGMRRIEIVFDDLERITGLYVRPI